MNLILAILWTFALITDIVAYAVGNEPSWSLVFCPLVCLVVAYWDRYFFDKHK